LDGKLHVRAGDGRISVHVDGDGKRGKGDVVVIVGGIDSSGPAVGQVTGGGVKIGGGQIGLRTVDGVQVVERKVRQLAKVRHTDDVLRIVSKTIGSGGITAVDVTNRTVVDWIAIERAVGGIRPDGEIKVLSRTPIGNIVTNESGVDFGAVGIQGVILITGPNTVSRVGIGGTDGVGISVVISITTNPLTTLHAKIDCVGSTIVTNVNSRE